MINLNEMINNALINIEKENLVENTIKKRIESTIVSIIDDLFSSYSDFGENLKTAIKSEINIDMSNLNIEKYNVLVASALQEKLDKIIKIQGVENLKKTCDKMLLNVKDTYKLSEIIERLKEYDRREEYEYEEDDKVSLYIERKKYGYTHIYIDLENTTKYSCKYSIHLNNDGIIYSLKAKEQELSAKTIMSGLPALEDYLFKIYAHGSKIELDAGDDPDDYDLYYTDEN